MTRAVNVSFVVRAALAACLAAGPARAADITVMNGADGGEGSLRHAIAHANPGDRIVFAGGVSEVKLTSGQLVIDKNLTIAGPGASLLRILRDPRESKFRIFHVRAGGGPTPVAASLSGLTIAGGEVDPWVEPGPFGGGILVEHSRLALRDCALVGNRADTGGGIKVNRGSLEMIDTTVAGNQCGVGGVGAIAPELSHVTIVGSTISGNLCGAIWSFATELTIQSSTISNNRSWSGDSGSALIAEAAPGHVLLDATTVVASEPHAFVTFDTERSENRIVVRYRNSIFQAPPGVATGIGVEVPGLSEYVSLGHNLFSDSPNNAVASDLTGTDARLAALASNGGATQTHALLADSPAINTGDCRDSAGHAIAVDQRGERRPAEGCDIGAFEVADDHAALLEAMSGVETRLAGTISSASEATAKHTLGGLAGAGVASQASVDGVRGLVEQANELLAARLDETVSSRASQASIEDMRAASAREAIERSLTDGKPLARHILPAAVGGQIENVRDVLYDVADRMQAAGLPVVNFPDQMAKANAQLSGGHYRRAWNVYRDIYQGLVGR